jgi:uncharacterized protein YegP (UPF0339 family)
MDIEWWQSTKNLKFYTRVVGANGEGVYVSQGYTTKGSAITSARAAIATLRYAQIRQRKFR